MKNTRFTMALAGIIALGFASWAHAAEKGNAARGARLVQQTCYACHGVHGRSVVPTFPRLAGQTPGYIEQELKNFRSHVEGDPEEQAFMWGMAAPLSDRDIRDLAAYFSQEKPVPGQAGDAELLAQGKDIFHNGIPSLNVPACAACHGATAQGQGAFPRLAGQHVDYLIKELKEFQNGTRANAIMHGIDNRMTQEQMKAVATYLRSL